MLKMDDFWVFLILLFLFLFINYSDNKVLEGWTNVDPGEGECARVTVLCSGSATPGGRADLPTGTLTYVNTGGSWEKEDSSSCVCDTTTKGFISAPGDTGICECPSGEEYCATVGKCVESWDDYAQKTPKPLGVGTNEWTKAR